MRGLVIISLTAVLLLGITPFYLSGCSGGEESAKLMKEGKEATLKEKKVGGKATTPGGAETDIATGAVKPTRLHIEPENPGRGDQLRAMMMESEGRAYYQWYVNGELVKEGDDPTLSTENLERGDSVMVKVRTKEGELVSEPVTIVNAPPVIKRAFLLPTSPKKGDILKVDLDVDDPDGDDVYLHYEWSINGLPAGGDSETLKADLRRGDDVSVKITPIDSEDSVGRTVERSVVVGNAPPVVEGGIKRLKVVNGILTGKIDAVDPDGDPVEFNVVDAPEGLEVDSDGNLRWVLPEAVSGSHTISVMVSDGHGGESVLSFELSLKPRKG